MINECFEKGLLKRTRKDHDRALGSLKIARSFIEKAEANIKINFPDVASLMAYDSMLQSVRAFLFDNGISERSHYCAIKYVSENVKESEIQSILKILNSYRILRHKIQYEGEMIEKKNSEEMIKDAKKLVDFMENKLKLHP